MSKVTPDMVFPKSVAERLRVPPHSRVWVGVILLKGRRGNGSDSGEAQGLRIGYRFMKIQ
ncbi:hypothetical protein [Stygiolobus sp. CP850M]|uniref:hypothetical protein n=1 Tax=Stygiolobus sp. CP850M TaxID=3133134 RepID=UPI00307EA469